MTERMQFNIHQCPSAALCCSNSGAITDINKRAEEFFDDISVGCNLDEKLDFSKTNLKTCSSFSDVVETLKDRAEEHQDILVFHNQQAIDQLGLHFSFAYEDEDSILIFLQDTSERAKLLETFEYQQNLLNSIFDTSSDALIVFDEHGYIELFSPAAELIFGQTSAEMTMQDVYCLYDKHSQDRLKDILNYLKGSTNSKEVVTFEDMTPVRSNGQSFPASLSFSTYHSGSTLLFFMVVTDKSVFHKFINSVNDAYIKTDESGLIIDINCTTEQLFRYSRSELINKHINTLEIKRNSESYELFDAAKMMGRVGTEEEFISSTSSGKEIILTLTIWPDENSQSSCHNIIIRDISQKKAAEQRLIKSASTDSLTALFNRAQFARKLNSMMVNDKGEVPRFTLMSVDLDEFKSVNDTFGHDYGDDLLIQVSQRLKACVRDDDLVFRMGGDEFTILVTGCVDQDAISEIATRILRSLSKEYKLKQKIVNVSASVGIAMYPEDGKTPEALIKGADTALYSVKRSGKNGYRYFTEEMNKENERKKRIERELLSGAAKEEFELYFQPKVSVSKNCVVGFEALLRWTSKELGFVSPGEFIPIAEDCGKIIDITRWVLKNGVKAVKRMSIAYPGQALSLAINISAKHFKEDLYGDIKKVLDEEQYEPNLLEVEITEGVLLEHTDMTIDMLKKINELGVHICLDDFGTGYSSLQYLQHFSADTLKIDRAFVREIDAKSQNSIIIESIVYIANRLDLALVVEGVETQIELDTVLSLGCDVVQGFYFSKPLPENDVYKYLENMKTNSPVPVTGIHCKMRK